MDNYRRKRQGYFVEISIWIARSGRAESISGRIEYNLHRIVILLVQSDHNSKLIGLT